MSRRLLAAALGIGAALAVVPASPATAACNRVILQATDLCVDPCYPVNYVLLQYGQHVDCM